MGSACDGRRWNCARGTREEDFAAGLRSHLRLFPNPGKTAAMSPVISVLHKKREDEIADKGRLDSGCISAVTALLRRDVEAEELLPIAASPRGLVNSVNASCSIAFLLAAVAIFLDLQTPSSITERLCRCRDFLCFPSW
nr:uncharacterized protein LOC110362310 isoform X6 [Columba livia]